MKMKSQFLLFAIGLLVGLVALGSTAAFGASITGTIVYEGDVPDLKVMKMDSDPMCSLHHTEGVKSEVIVLGLGKTIGNVFVRIKSGLPDEKYPIPTEPVILDQKGCMYSPHVFGVLVGQELKILNPDNTLHNVHAMPRKNPSYNTAMPKFRKEASKIFTKEEFMFPIKCDVHPWMGTWCAVMAHPFFDVTEKDGKFKIEGLKAGTYEIEAWHERLKTRTATVAVTADEAKTVDFSFAIPTKKK